ncbi:chemokine (C-X-C motif) ligand 18b [Pygocentrus nattereri]|uniref:C-X-C motif chemokine 10-like n=1 Tax=Pygocentrus nattereri TaxID=42514 RepID=UPI0008144028|nr:C-X-C motif chemokine 10-like [Pygocentrus nattereri]XP_037399118.1 chemokine (C-X-C motif) ligand 18b [Pygocentrus nattereri]
MAFPPKALCLVLVAVVCIQLSNATVIPVRCECLRTSTRPYSWRIIKEFSITPPHSHCKDTEIILTLHSVNPNTGKNDQRCLSPDLHQAKKLETCWNRKNKDDKKVLQISECLPRK